MPPCAQADPACSVHVLGGPWLTIDAVQRPIPDGARRLLAFLALDHRPLDRPFVAGTLWPDSDEERAAGCLRTALWRLRRAGLDLVQADPTSVQLRPHVRVDAADAFDWAERILDGSLTEDDLGRPERWAPALDLLPGWCDDWACAARELLRQRVLHALDRIGDELSLRGRHAEAVAAAQLAVAAEPLRETAQRSLVHAHLAEGNLSEARRCFTAFVTLLASELGATPSHSFMDLLTQHADADHGARVTRPASCRTPDARLVG